MLIKCLFFFLVNFVLISGILESILIFDIVVDGNIYCC